MTPQELLDAHPGIAVLSVDFFDTLVTRTVAQPTHVFAVMEQRLVAGRGDRWRGFALRRVLAERSARKETASIDEHSDITLHDVLRHLAAGMDLSVAERAELADIERATELELTEPVAWGVDLVRQARGRGLRVIVVSDNYMPAEHLVRVAGRAGVTLSTDDIIVSCEHASMKHDGSIWSTVVAAAGVPAGSILHVGDLADADGTIPASRGLRTAVFPQMRVSHREPLNTCPAVLPLSRVEAHNRSAGVVDPVVNLAGGALAIIVAGQVLDVIRRAAETRVSGIHFTSRDGHLAHLVFERVSAAVPGLPAHSYTEVSRSIAWRASLTSVDEASVHRFIGDDEVMTMDRLRRRFGCELTGGHSDDERISAPEARAVVLRNAPAVESACRSLRSRFVEYLAAQGVTAPGHHLVMDLGWSGSVVAHLAAIARGTGPADATFEGRLTALYWDASANRSRVNLSGLAVDEFAGTHDNVRLLGTIRYFESLLTAPHGSVVDYRDARAVRDDTHCSVAPGGLPWEEFERTVVDNAARIVLGSHELVRPEEVDGNVVWATMMQVANSPTDAEVSALGGLLHDTALDHAGKGNELVAAPPAGFTAGRSAAVFDKLVRHHWLQGSLAAWRRDSSTRWIADEVVRFEPAVAPQWVRP